MWRDRPVRVRLVTHYDVVVLGAGPELELGEFALGRGQVVPPAQEDGLEQTAAWVGI